MSSNDQGPSGPFSLTVGQQLDDAGIGVQYHFTPGLCGTEFTMPAGSSIGKHVHDYSHLSMLMQGAAVVEVCGVATTHKAPAVLTIEAGKEHIIRALSPVVWLCLHATDETEPEALDASLRGVA